MTISIELDQDYTATLSVEAERLGVSTEQLAVDILQRHLRNSNSSAHQQLPQAEFEEHLRQSTSEHAETLRRLAQ